MYDLNLSAEQIEFRDTVREFAEKEIRPAAIHPDRLQGYTPQLLTAQLAQASAMGLRTLALSEAAGGAGADTLTACIVMSELAAGDAGIASVLAQTSTLAHALFDAAMSDEQRARFLPAFIADEDFHLAVAADLPEPDTEWCYHRPAAAVAPTLSARREANGDWLLGGTVDQVANAALAKLFAVAVHADGAPQNLLVPRDTSGLTVRESAETPVWYHGTRGALVFDRCRVPAANALPRHCSDQTPAAALQRNAINLGLARAAYDAALAHAQLKVQGARRIVEHEGVGILLAESLLRLEAARSLLWQTAWAVDHPAAIGSRSIPDLPLVELTGVFVAEAAHAGDRACRRGVRRHGHSARHAVVSLRARSAGISARRARRYRRQARHCRSDRRLPACAGRGSGIRLEMAC